MPRPSHSSRFDYPNNISWWVICTLDNKNTNICLLAKLIFRQPVNQFPATSATQRYVTVFVRSRYMSLSWARLVQCIAFYFSQVHLNIILPPICA
jgi:hypothetical protein